MRGRAVLVATAVLLGAACGGDGPGIDRRAARALDEQVDLVEFAIAAGRYDAARQGVANVRAKAEADAARGDISPFRLRAITSSLDRLDEALAEAAAG